MAELLFFNPKQNTTSIDHIIFKLLPKSKEEGWKADEAERLLEPMQLLYYYGYVIVYGVLHLLPEEHRESVMNLVDAGIMDDIVAEYAPDLTDSYVTKDKFYYKEQEYKLPWGYIPRMRYIDENEYILVDSLSAEGEPKLFRFLEGIKEWEVWRNAEE